MARVGLVVLHFALTALPAFLLNLSGGGLAV